MNFYGQDERLSRRHFLGLAAAAGAAVAARPASAQPPSRAMVMHRSGGCGCCLAYAERARSAGFAVTVKDNSDMRGLKRRLRVPAELESCHTVEIGGYVVEGHVPLDDVAKLLRERPREVRGIAVPGMPIGSPGMEVPGGERQAFVTFAFDAAGRRRTFTRHAASG